MADSPAENRTGTRKRETLRERSERRLAAHEAVPISCEVADTGSGRLGQTLTVLRRALVLALLDAFSNQLDRQTVCDSFDQFGLWETLSPHERALFDKPHHSYQDRLLFSGQGAATALLWALGLFDTCNLGDEWNAFEKRMEEIYRSGPDGAVEAVRWQDPVVIADKADNYYYYRYLAPYEAMPSGLGPDRPAGSMEPTPGALDADTVNDLRCGFRWLTTLQAWDDTR